MNFDDLCSSLVNIHEHPWNPSILEKAEDILCGKDSGRKAILIDLLFSLEIRISVCSVAADYGSRLMPLFKRVLHDFTQLADNGSEEIHYAMAKLLAVLIVSGNQDQKAAVASTLSNLKPSFKSLCCRRLLTILSKNRPAQCDQCLQSSSISTDSSSWVDFLLNIWSNLLSDLCNDHSMDYDSVVDILSTSDQLLASDSTKERAMEFITVSWSTTFGKPILNLLTSNRLIVRNTLELLYGLLSNILHDSCVRQTSSNAAEQVAADLLDKFASHDTIPSLEKASKVHSKFGDIADDGGVGGTDSCIIRLSIILPMVAKAILANMDSKLDYCAASTAVSFASIDLSNHQQTVSLLIEQDDHFCDFFLSCVSIQKHTNNCDFDVHEIWLHFLNHIGWNCGVVLEWITTSDTTFLMALLRYLKLIIENPNMLMEKCGRFPLVKYEDQEISSQSNEDPDPSHSSSSVHFTMAEIIGNVERNRTVFLQPLRRRSEIEQKTTTIEDTNIESNVRKFFRQLFVKLDRLHTSNLIGFNIRPLLNLLHRVNELK